LAIEKSGLANTTSCSNIFADVSGLGDGGATDAAAAVSAGAAAAAGATDGEAGVVVIVGDSDAVMPLIGW